MILLTVGTQLPFDRLVRIVDGLAETLPHPVVAQIGYGKYEPLHMDWRRVVPPQEFERLVATASLVVAHAGIGTLVTAERHGKSLILFPRSAELGEHRNDHQKATIRALAGRPGVGVATTPEELRELILNPPPPSTPQVKAGNQRQICGALAAFLENVANEV